MSKIDLVVQFARLEGVRLLVEKFREKRPGQLCEANVPQKPRPAWIPALAPCGDTPLSEGDRLRVGWP